MDDRDELDESPKRESDDAEARQNIEWRKIWIAAKLSSGGERMNEMQVLQLLSALGVLLFGVGAVLSFWLMRRPWMRVKRFVGQGGTTRGVVVGHVGAGFTESNATMYSPEIEFVDRTGRTFRITSSMSSTHPSPIGTPVDVAYDVNDPGKGVVVGAARILALVGVGMAVLFTLCAAGSAVAFAFVALAV